jgi:succinyl-CoA synthetase beta subunit
VKIHEYQAMEMFKSKEIPVPTGELVENEQSAIEAAKRIGYPLVLKAQVLTGGRGKAGGIKKVSSENELIEQYARLRNLTIKGYPVEKIFVVQALDIRQEYYFAVTVHSALNRVVVMASSEGGVDIEETARTRPEAIRRLYLGKERILPKNDLDEFLSGLFLTETIKAKAQGLIQKLVDLLFAMDASLVEVNPLIVDSRGELIAADAKVNLDDSALFRHPEWVAERDPRYEDIDEMDAREKNLSFVKLDGNVGCVVNGAGLAMGTMDIIKLSGGAPANFLDVGGSSNPEKVVNALTIILRNPKVKVILINIFGGITRCDDIARGILKARETMDLPVPLVVRLTGTNETEAKALLDQYGVTTFSDMRQAVHHAVAFAQS